MNYRQFIELSAATMETSITLAGCLGSEESEDVEGTENNTDSEEEEPEPEGGDGHPYTHYELDVPDDGTYAQHSDSALGSTEH